MQDQTISSAHRLAASRRHLEDALSRLENLIIKQTYSLEGERQIRTQVIEDLDKHIANLETILEDNG